MLKCWPAALAVVMAQSRHCCVSGCWHGSWGAPPGGVGDGGGVKTRAGTARTELPLNVVSVMVTADDPRSKSRAPDKVRGGMA